jgi:hypothetical protein
LKLIKIRYKEGQGKPTDQNYYIMDNRFDERRMIYVGENEPPKHPDVFTSEGCPGIITTTYSQFRDSHHGLTYKNKLDEGAVEEVLDKGIEEAKARAVERNKKQGSSFRKIKRFKNKRKK